MLSAVYYISTTVLQEVSDKNNPLISPVENITVTTITLLPLEMFIISISIVAMVTLVTFR